jgi:putative two-component system response regulator
MIYGPVLCVDDEPDNLAVLRETLQDEHRLVFARSGPEALRAVAKHQPSLILLDICMPAMDGYEVCCRLKADPASMEIPVIFVTALSEADNEELGFAAGCVDYIAKPISPPIVKARVRTHLSLVRSAKLEASYREAVHMLAAVSNYSDPSETNFWRIGGYSAALAAAVGWPRYRCELMELAAPLHDTGQIGIPMAILQKPGKFDHEEVTTMRAHTRIGHDIFSRSEAPLFELAAEIALSHHERWDGTGYPDGLAGEDIPESARIVAVADAFDALSIKRPYREPWPLPEVLDHLQEYSGTHFEPRLVDVFLRKVLPTLLPPQIEAHLRPPSRPVE